MQVRYRSLIADSARWAEFELRPSDIVISTPPKSGTTWTQMLCALLVFGGPDFPRPLNELTLWLDQSIRSIDEVRAVYDPQAHRRLIKTHTPLDGLPLRDDVTYVVVGRDPRDVMVSMEHHLGNLDMERVLAMRGRAVGNDDLDSLPGRPPHVDDPRERFRLFVTITEHLGPATLRGVLHHHDTAWQRRTQPNVVMCHYADLTADLPGELVRLAAALGYDLDRPGAAELAAHATLDGMRERAEQVAPNAGELWHDTKGFFRRGGFGEWRSRVGPDELALYDEVVRESVCPELAAWVHDGRIRSGVDPATA